MKSFITVSLLAFSLLSSAADIENENSIQVRTEISYSESQVPADPAFFSYCGGAIWCPWILIADACQAARPSCYWVD